MHHLSALSLPPQYCWLKFLPNQLQKTTIKFTFYGLWERVFVEEPPVRQTVQVFWNSVPRDVRDPLADIPGILELRLLHPYTHRPSNLRRQVTALRLIHQMPT